MLKVILGLWSLLDFLSDVSFPYPTSPHGSHTKTNLFTRELWVFAKMGLEGFSADAQKTEDRLEIHKDLSI